MKLLHTMFEDQQNSLFADLLILNIWKEIQFKMCIQLSPSSFQAAVNIQVKQSQSSAVKLLRGLFRAAVWALLFDVLLEQGWQVGRVMLQHGRCVGGQHCQAADQLTVDNGHWWQFGVVDHTLCAQQRVVYAGPCSK